MSSASRSARRRNDNSTDLILDSAKLPWHRFEMDEEQDGHCSIDVWDHEHGALGGTTTLAAGSWLTRPGGPETREDLETDARRAARHGYPHGVSVRHQLTAPKEGRAATGSQTVGHFQLLKTGAAEDHFTVRFADPVTEAAADTFAALFIPR